MKNRDCCSMVWHFSSNAKNVFDHHKAFRFLTFNKTLECEKDHHKDIFKVVVLVIINFIWIGVDFSLYLHSMMRSKGTCLKFLLLFDAGLKRRDFA